ncbi:phage terminase large subunit family protein [Ensifer canadensis]
MSQEQKQKDTEAHAQLVALYHQDIDIFAKAVLGVHLTPKQLEICEAFQNNRTITVKGAVGFGKTACLAVLCWWSLCTHDDLQVTIFGPSEGTLKSTVWKELQKYHDRMAEPFRSMFNVGAQKIDRKINPATCFCEYRLASAENISAARGIHAPNNFVFADEASGIADVVFTDALVNILSDDNAKLCLISNPSSTSGFFARTWRDPEMAPEWTHVHGRYHDKYNFKPEDLKLQAALYGGPTSRNFRVYIEGEFPLTDVEGLIPLEYIDAAVANETAVPGENIPVLWGLDPASAGKDTSVLCQRHDNKVLEFKEWQGLDPAQLSRKIYELYQQTPKRERPAVIAVDSAGLGDGVEANLKREFGLETCRVIFKNRPTRNVEKFVSLKDQIYWETREWLASEEVSIPNNARLIEELASVQYDDTSGKIKIEEKKLTKKRIGRSPDHFDALALTFSVSPSRYSGNFSWSKPIEYDWLQIYE